MTKNRARDIERKITAIEKNVREAWEKHQNPNLWGGGPTCDPQGKIVALNIKAFGHVAKFFEREEIQREITEACRKNNMEYTGFEKEAVVIQTDVESQVPAPPKPIFLLTSYQLQSYLSTLIRYINRLSGAGVPGGLTWGLNNKEAQLPSGWNNELLDFFNYGGPGIKYGGQGKLPPMLKDIITHYFYLLGENPNEFAKEIPDDFEPRQLDDLSFIPPPPGFVIPDWATPFQPDESMEGESLHFTSRNFSSNSAHFVSSQSSTGDGRIVLTLTRRTDPSSAPLPPSSPATRAGGQQSPPAAQSPLRRRGRSGSTPPAAAAQSTPRSRGMSRQSSPPPAVQSPPREGRFGSTAPPAAAQSSPRKKGRSRQSSPPPAVQSPPRRNRRGRSRPAQPPAAAQSPPRRRGRSRQSSPPTAVQSPHREGRFGSTEPSAAAQSPPRRRGRSRQSSTPSAAQSPPRRNRRGSSASTPPAQSQLWRRGRSRPSPPPAAAQSPRRRRRRSRPSSPTTPSVSPLPTGSSSQRGPPSPPRKRARAACPASPSPSPPPAPPCASSTMRTHYDMIQTEKSPVVQRLNKQAFRKTARLSGGVGTMCVYCAETVTRQDIKMRNNLVSCSGHKVHKYCQRDCMETHAGIL